MPITHYIKDIGRGKDGARHLDRTQACDLFGQVLDGTVTDVELGAFVLAMRIKGETPQEMAGFLDAASSRLNKVPASTHTTIVLPSYNGARKLPTLTPLLALLLAREGLPVLVHGSTTEQTRVTSQSVLAALGVQAASTVGEIEPGSVQFLPTSVLCPGLQRLLDVRRLVGLRNSAHSLVKLMNPCQGPAVLVSSYTHPEYAVSMNATLCLMQQNALLLRGTEGEPVADARRTPAMDAISAGVVTRVQEAQAGPLNSLPDLPSPEVASTATWIRDVLMGKATLPTPVAQQVTHILKLARETATNRANG